MEKARKIFIAGNWKMNKTIAEATDLVKALKRDLAGIRDVDIAVCPPFTALHPVGQLLDNTNIHLGGQDLYWDKFGAFTGEVNAAMLKDVLCTYVIIGHSERRQFFHETNETVNKKTKAALAARLKPIVCVGETLAEREAGGTEMVVQDHVLNGLAGLSAEELAEVTIAYEPVWAIGTGKTATSQQAQEVHAFIRKLLEQLSDAKTAARVRIQYGGSVKPSNAHELMSQPDVDGALVGGASLAARDFVEIIQNARK
ncbi:MAG: triose-phosphate isomerase [Verrucomicrobia bacterium]|nr:triose-phosphate isomerase [Verrucomicrobiota bacterium]